MSPYAAQCLYRALAALWAACFLGGCGRATIESAPATGAPDAAAPARLQVVAMPAGNRIEPAGVVPASYPASYQASPLPAIDEGDGPADEIANEPADGLALPMAPPALEAPGMADDIEPAELSAPAHESAAGAAVMPQFPSAYAVAPRRAVTADDRIAPLSGPSDPTPQLVAAARQADLHVRRGFRLAERGAVFTAKAELTQALRISAAALDEQRRTNAHSRALNNGLRALAEAEEFLPAVRVSDFSAASLEATARGHRTPIAIDAASGEWNAARAIEQYLTYAQVQLAAAGGDLQPAASALYALGKLEMTAASEIGSLESVRAAVYLQAALMVNPRHALAANELGVLLARRGRLMEAKAALSHTVQIASLPTAWRNLSIVHQGLGELELASQADARWRQAAAATPDAAAGVPAVEWVDPATFARSAPSGGMAPASASR